MNAHLWQDRSCFRVSVGILWAFCLCRGVDQASGVPVIYCDEPEYHYGVRQQGSAPLQHSFRIENLGDAPLVITAVRRAEGCGCGGSGIVADRHVNPGSNTLISVSLPMDRGKGVVSEGWSVESNDPQVPRYYLTVSGIIAADVEVRPQIIDFGDIATDTVVKRIAEIVCQSNMLFQITNAVSSTAKFAVSIERIDSWHHRLNIQTVPSRQRGNIRGNIRISTDNPECHELMVFVAANLPPTKVLIVPEEIKLGSSATNPTVWIFAIASKEKKPFKIRAVISPDPTIKTSFYSLGADSYRIRMENVHLSHDIDGKNLMIETDIPDAEQILVPIHVE